MGTSSVTYVLGSHLLSWHPMRTWFESWLLHFLTSSLLMRPGKSVQDSLKFVGSWTHKRDLEEVSGFWYLPGPALRIAAIWGGISSGKILYLSVTLHINEITPVFKNRVYAGNAPRKSVAYEWIPHFQNEQDSVEKWRMQQQTIQVCLLGKKISVPCLQYIVKKSKFFFFKFTQLSL